MKRKYFLHNLIFIFGAILPFSSVNLFGNSFLNLLFIVVYALIIFTIPRIFSSKNFTTGYSFIFSLALVSIFFISAAKPNFTSPFNTYSMPRQLLLGVGVFFIFRFLTLEIPGVYFWLKKGILFGLILASISIFIGFGAYIRGGERLSFHGMNPNYLALLFLMGIMFLVFDKDKQLPFKAFKKKWVILTVIGTFSYIIYWTGSRTGVAALALVILFIYLKSKINLTKKIITGILLACSFYIGIHLYLSYSVYGERFQTTETTNNVIEEDSRTMLWWEAINAMQEKKGLFWGIGVDGWDQYVVFEKRIRGIPKGIHNTYLSLWVFSGVLGLGLFLLFLYRTYIYSLIIEKKINVVLFKYFFVVYIFYGLFHDLFLIEFFWGLSGIVHGLKVLVQTQRA